MENVSNDYSQRLTVLKDFMSLEDMKSYFGLKEKTFSRWEQMGLKAINLSAKTKFYRAEDIREFMEKMS